MVGVNEDIPLDKIDFFLNEVCNPNAVLLRDDFQLYIQEVPCKMRV